MNDIYITTNKRIYYQNKINKNNNAFLNKDQSFSNLTVNNDNYTIIDEKIIYK